MRFDLTDLSLFRHVVEAGSITHGAQRSNLALAAASTRIRNMEETLGVALLTRGRAGVTPTQAGRTLLQHARTILRQAERLHEDLGAYSGQIYNTDDGNTYPAKITLRPDEYLEIQGCSGTLCGAELWRKVE